MYLHRIIKIVTAAVFINIGLVLIEYIKFQKEDYTSLREPLQIHNSSKKATTNISVSVFNSSNERINSLLTNFSRNSVNFSIITNKSDARNHSKRVSTSLFNSSSDKNNSSIANSSSNAANLTILKNLSNTRNDAKSYNISAFNSLNQRNNSLLVNSSRNAANLTISTNLSIIQNDAKGYIMSSFNASNQKNNSFITNSSIKVDTFSIGTNISNTTDQGNFVQSCLCPNVCTSKVLDRIIKNGNNKNVSCRQQIQHLMDSDNISEGDACIQTSNTNQSRGCGIECDPTQCHLSIKNQSNQNIDLVVKLSGELGNHLFSIAMAKSMQYLAEEYNYAIQFKLHYLGQGLGKSKTPARDIPACFPSLKSSNFKECNVPSYGKILSQQEHLYGKNITLLSAKSHLRGSINASVSEFQHMLQFGLNSIKEERSIPFHQLQSILGSTNILPLSIPFLHADTFASFEFVDRYQLQLQKYFNFKYSSPFCCKRRPDPNATVIHIRGFLTEMPRVGKRPEYTELNAYRTSNELLSHLKKGEKVVLLSRFPTTLQPYKVELEKRGLQVEIVAGQSGIQDFCFLMSTTKELIGTIQSTYVFWASFLSTSVNKVTLYRVSKNKRTIPQFFNSKLANYNFPVY